MITSKPAEMFFCWDLQTIYNIIYIVTWLIYGVIISTTSIIDIFDEKKKITEENIEQNWIQYRHLWNSKGNISYEL